MPAVRLRLPAAFGTSRGTPRPRRAAIYGEVSGRLELPLSPKLSHGGLGLRWQADDRVGRKPLNTPAGANLRTYSTTLELVARRQGVIDPQASVEDELRHLRSFARSGERVRWERMGPSEGGWFHLTDVVVDDELRQQGTRAITWAKVSITMTEASTANVRVGPVTGGAELPPAAGPASSAAATTGAGGAPVAPASTSHTVTGGESLFAIALRYYGRGDLWPTIADANRITDPRTLSVGKVLTIPPKPA